MPIASRYGTHDEQLPSHDQDPSSSDADAPHNRAYRVSGDTASPYQTAEILPSLPALAGPLLSTLPGHDAEVSLRAELPGHPVKSRYRVPVVPLSSCRDASDRE